VTEANSRVRLGVIGVIVIVLFTGLFARLWFLQLGEAKSYAAQTEANRVRIITEPAVRGSILDSQGRIIVQSRLVNSIQVRRGLTDRERARMVPRLAKVLKVKEKYINRRLDSVRYSPYQPVPIKDRVPYRTLVYIKERPEEFPRVDVVRRSIRVYPVFDTFSKVYPNPFEELTPGSHLLGYTGAINSREQKLHKEEGYGPEDIIGKVGVEQMFETELRGSPHTRKLEVNSRGQLVEVLKDKEAIAGNDVQLTIDIEVQRVVEESILQGMKKAGGLRDPTIKDRFKTYGAKGGAAVVLDARDGSVVALASAPTYDVREFTDGIPVEKYTALNDPKSSYPLLNRTIQGQYAPGSTFKTFTAIAALENGITNPAETIIDKGFVEFGNEGDAGSLQTFKNAGKERHGAVQLQSAISVSSDVYFYIMGFRFWNAYNKDNVKKGYGIQHVAKRFGFGHTTNIGLADEHAGRVPDRKFKARINKNSENEEARFWLPGDSAALAVGQGDFLVTPLQLASAYAAFANGGTLYAPRVAKAILSPGGATQLRELPPQKIGSVKLNPKVRELIMNGLKGAVIGIGTAGPAFQGYSGMPIAGKTGTAEVFGKQDTSVFALIVNPDVPADSGEPQYVVVVFIEEGGNGGSVAAPIAKRIALALNGDLNPPEVKLVPPKTPGGDR
jgi:penicillin-binding protein 2